MTTETLIQESQHLTPPVETKQVPTRRDVPTLLNYYCDPGDGSPPMPVYVGGGTVTNERPTIPTPVTVHDISGEEDKYTLSSHGFQLIHHQSNEKEFREEEKIKEEYYRECEKLILDITAGKRAFLFGHLARRGPSNWHRLGQGNAAKKGPLHRVHIDQSYEGAEMILRNHLPDEADELMKRRWQIINIWRPIRTIYKDPLAVASAQSIPDEDLIPASVIYPKSRNETFTVKPNPTHRWFFKNAQKPDEVLFIKCFDSDTTVARRVPHCAFRDAETDNREDRESIEVRSLVFH
ncbi:hypothetical protein K469DRAFT_606717 [Zopfia rhizophila CBS 207.26]|uniref:Methyltransferase n=1 Tax=Zopfia rhizophila CBS 207.26 TaxID=1314779 RepID=A0A6A6DAS5_9PEZI|nr:hypothetical protein K469DRAFT_606717 [Zopfia rhizophila CBS 207.26]